MPTWLRETCETICQETVRPGMSASPFLTITWSKVEERFGWLEQPSKIPQYITENRCKFPIILSNAYQRFSQHIQSQAISDHRNCWSPLHRHVVSQAAKWITARSGPTMQPALEELSKSKSNFKSQRPKTCRGSNMFFKDVWDSKWPTSGWSHRPTLCCLEQTCACGSPFGAHGSSSCPAGTAKHGGKLLFKSCQNLHRLVTWNQAWNVSDTCASSQAFLKRRRTRWFTKTPCFIGKPCCKRIVSDKNLSK